MFRLKANPTFVRAVVLRSLDGEECTLRLVMRHKRLSELKAFTEALAGRPSEDIVADLVAGWEDVDTPFSLEALHELLEEWACAPGRVWEEYQAAYTEATRKN